MLPLALTTFHLLAGIGTAGLVAASDAVPNDLSSLGEIWTKPLMVAIVAVVMAVSLVTVLAGCAYLCPCRERFKTIEDDNPFPGIDFPNPPSHMDLGIYPPIEGTPDQIPVSFEPLPDVSTLIRHKMLARSNIIRLRPKVSHVVRDRLDSEEDMDGALYRDSIHTKLDKLIATNTKQPFQRNQLNYIKELGCGWFGKVLQSEGQGILPGHKKTAAIVQILREDADKFDQYGFLQESAPYRDTGHPNVLKLFGHCVETMPYLTVLELCANGDLKMYLRSQRPNVEIIDKQGLLLNFACDMAAGLQAMHLKNYIHRDFAIRNCLLTADLTVKIGDYGLSEEMYKDDYLMDSTGAFIPIRWLAPEVITFNNGSGITLRHITKDCNLWSFGVALWELVTFGCLPYGELDNEKVLKLVVFEQSIRLLRPEIPISNLHHLYQLMEMCWLTPEQRPSLRELRIMLLHLQSSKDELDTHAFDQKWNQLLPRHHAGIHNQVATIEAHDITVLSSEEDSDFFHHTGIMGGRIMDNFQQLHERNAMHHSRMMDSRFSELDPALLVHSGELQSSMLSWTKVDLEPRPFSKNELSLEAELGAEMLSSFQVPNEDKDYSEERDEFILVSLPNEQNPSAKSFQVDHSSKSAVKHPVQQIHLVAEVHRPSVELRDDFSKKPLLNSKTSNEVANSCEVSSSEEGFEELNREERIVEIDNGDSKGKAESPEVKLGLDGSVEQSSVNSELKAVNNFDVSFGEFVRSEDKLGDLLNSNSEHLTSRTEDIRKDQDGGFTVADKSNVEVKADFERENNNTVLSQDRSAQNELPVIQDSAPT